MPTEFRNLSKKKTLSVLYKLPPIPQYILGKMVWVHPRARFSVSASTFFRGEPHVRGWLVEHLKPGDVFFDVGAHHGWVSMLALNAIGQEGAVYSFEPSPANISILEWHKNRNKFSQWFIVPNAVSNEDAFERRFFLIDSGDSPMNSLTSGVPGMLLMEGRAIQDVSIQTITIDTFCSKTGVRPNLVKIDVEGAELLVLHGAEELLRESHPIIILAVHPYWLPSGQSTLHILEFLENNGYSVYDSNNRLVGSLRNGEYLCLNSKSQSFATR